MSRGPNWSPAEKQTLRRIYPTATKPELIAAFPQRSWCAIGRMAQDMGIKRDRETLNAERSETALAAQRGKKGSALGPKQVVIRCTAPARDSGLVAQALQAQPQLHAAWMGRAL